VLDGTAQYASIKMKIARMMLILNVGVDYPAVGVEIVLLAGASTETCARAAHLLTLQVNESSTPVYCLVGGLNGIRRWFGVEHFGTTLSKACDDPVGTSATAYSSTNPSWRNTTRYSVQWP
jgi:hypothetical protein